MEQNYKINTSNKGMGQPELFALFIIHLEHLYEPVGFPIQSFRIRTPPEMKGSWKENILKLDPKSDNSDSNDILVNLIYLHTVVLYTNSFPVICNLICSQFYLVCYSFLIPLEFLSKTCEIKETYATKRVRHREFGHVQEGKKNNIWPVLSQFYSSMFLFWLSSCANDVQVQSSFSCKSPGTVLKLAAIKRMRDAGWTTVNNSDKKKKKVTDNIFA